MIQSLNCSASSSPFTILSSNLSSSTTSLSNQLAPTSFTFVSSLSSSKLVATRSDTSATYLLPLSSDRFFPLISFFNPSNSFLLAVIVVLSSPALSTNSSISMITSPYNKLLEIQSFSSSKSVSSIFNIFSYLFSMIGIKSKSDIALKSSKVPMMI